MTFEWDEAKAERNRQKHGVSLQEAVSVFDDPLSELFDDTHHSEQEPRLILIGPAQSGKLLVSFTERPDATRIISARRATKREQNDYGA